MDLFSFAVPTPQSVFHPRSSKDWDRYRDIIQRLYVAEDKTLDEVMKKMALSHSFSATARQYKRKINEWRLDKNVKDEEMRVIIATRKTRLQQGKKSVFYVRGRPLDPKKIDRFCLRKHVDSSAQEDQSLGKSASSFSR